MRKLQHLFAFLAHTQVGQFISFAVFKPRSVYQNLGTNMMPWESS